jgi:hypothetical protein
LRSACLKSRFDEIFAILKVKAKGPTAVGDFWSTVLQSADDTWMEKSVTGLSDKVINLLMKYPKMTINDIRDLEHGDEQNICGAYFKYAIGRDMLVYVGSGTRSSRREVGISARRKEHEATYIQALGLIFAHRNGVEHSVRLPRK